VVAVLLAAGSAALLARKAASPLAQTVAMQRRFVADASHELRTPLTLLSTRAQMQLRRLEREQASTRATTEAQAIVRDVATMTEIVDDLLSTSAQPRDEGCEPVDVADLARQVVDAATPHATERHIRIRYASRLTPQDPRQVGGRPAALRRALTALVDNAIEHAAGEVEVSVAATRRHLTVSVSDDGPGVDESVRDRIFEPFFTGTASSTSASPSASPSDDPGSSRRHYGIGLALVAGIATDHKGEITVAEPREAGSGTRFVLSLPAWRH
jgi:signal transduction histidine kinase